MEQINFIFTLIAAILLTPSFSFANCGFQTVAGDLEVATVQGSKVHTLFAEKVDTAALVNIQKDLISDEPALVSTRLNLLLLKPENKNLVRKRRAEAEKVIEMLDSGQIQWMGVDGRASATVKDNNDQRHIASYQPLLSHFTTVLQDAEKAEDLMYLIFGPQVIAQIKRPEKFAKMKTISVPDAFELQNLENLEMEMVSHDARLQAIFNKKQIDKAQYDEYQRLKTQAIEGEEEIPFATILALQEQVNDPNAKAIVSNFLIAADKIRRQKALLKDIKVQPVLEQSGDGLIVTSADSAQDVKSQLNAACAQKPEAEGTSKIKQ